MNPKTISRRSFVKNAALAAAAAQIPAALRAAPPSSPSPASAGVSAPQPARGSIRWLDGSAPALNNGATWGMPWPRGSVAKDAAFALRDAAGKSIPVQSWPTAFWPDGSLKWTAHAVPAGIEINGGLALAPGQKPAAPAQAVTVRDASGSVVVDTGVIRATIAKSGATLVRAIARDGRDVLVNGRLVAMSADTPDADEAVRHTTSFESDIAAVTIEQAGPVRAVVKIEGRHRQCAAAPADAAVVERGQLVRPPADGPSALHIAASPRAWLPFTVRLYFYAGGEAVRVMHSFVYDGDPEKDFLRGIGVRFEVPMTDLPHDRHVRFAGEGKGLWAEAVRGLTGLRRDPDGRANPGPIKTAQLAGLPCPPVETFNPQVRERLHYIPAWGDFTLTQPAANAFTIRKRTKPGHGWIDVDQGRRASGTGYIGGATGGGVVFGLRDFWQRHPVQLDIRGAHTDRAEVTLWMYSPEAQPMDLRFYHDGMGMDDFRKQYDGGLEITYEDYEPGYGNAHGVARSSEIMLWAVAATPSRDRLVEMAAAVRTPPVLVCAPEVVLNAKVFGALWSLPDRSTPAKAAIEERLDWQFDYHRKQVDQRHWYGFWSYGDVMHSYDRDRHVWKYDVGGFAWDNSELSTDLWLWYYFLRTGRADVFRFAEAMTRHTGEVDVYHTGKFAGLGTRHNVQHWGCSAKQVRISTAAYRRVYYYLTADERVGDLMRELLDVDKILNSVDPARKLTGATPLGKYDSRLSFGTDWANLAVAWLTEWERGGDTRYRDKLLRGLRDWGAMPTGFFTSDRYGYQIASGSLEPLTVRGRPGGSDKTIGVSHLDSVFGAVETFAELIQLTAGQPEYEGFAKAWIQYCTLYSAARDEQRAALGADIRGNGLRQAHSRLTAYAAKMTGDKKLAARAWKEFGQGDFADHGLADTRASLKTSLIEGPDVLNPVDEATWVSTNDAAQWGLAAIECLALIGEQMPE
ncbi:Tat pathway signal sequence domain protein [Termitidicoccus mucosus]|uniref:exo-rhamnogalacturonan lyase family protein n=1 Tax=Termitidicoccus mucosus TaxID=1184151 RepID=UPI00318411AE